MRTPAMINGIRMFVPELPARGLSLRCLEQFTRDQFREESINHTHYDGGYSDGDVVQNRYGHRDACNGADHDTVQGPLHA